MRFPSSLLRFFVTGGVLISASLPAQQPLPAQLELHLQAAEARVAQASGQNDGEAWWRLAMLEQDAARYRDAERSYLRAIPLLEAGDKATLADALDSAGTLYVETGDYAHAEPLELRALALREARNDSLGEGVSWMHLAMLSLGRHETVAAVRYAEMARERLVDGKSLASLEASQEEKMTALIDLSLALCADNRSARAMGPLEQAHRLAEADQGATGGMPIGWIDFLLGYARWHMGDTAEAGRLMKSGLAGMELQLGFGHPTYVAALTEYRNFLEQTGDLADAAVVRARLARMAGAVEMASAAAEAQAR